MPTPNPTISAAIFEEQFQIFSTAIEEESGAPFVSFQQGLPDKWEGYKQRIYREGRARLGWDKWKSSEIGTGRVIDSVVHAIEINEGSELRNNLVNWQAKYGPESRSHRGILDARTDSARRRACEELLFQLYRREGEPGELFEALAELISRRYDVLAYLFFLRDWESFLPIAPSVFDEAFVRLGLDVRTSKRCSWENYQSYIAAIDAVRQRLRGKGCETVRLVDAHSFCWMLVRLPAASNKPVKAKRITMTEERGLIPAPPRDPATLNGDSTVDFTALNERRAYLGDLAEDIALEAERNRLRSLGRADLASQVRNVASDHRLGYDIASFEPDGSPRYIEVKAASPYCGGAEFYLTENEHSQSATLPNYWLYLVFQVETIHPSIRCVPIHSLPVESMKPVVYRARVLFDN